jgi:hypothetical protein
MEPGRWSGRGAGSAAGSTQPSEFTSEDRVTVDIYPLIRIMLAIFNEYKWLRLAGRLSLEYRHEI